MLEQVKGVVLQNPHLKTDQFQKKQQTVSTQVTHKIFFAQTHTHKATQ